jgi:hypothetical protein
MAGEVSALTKIAEIPGRPSSAILMSLRSSKELVANALRSVPPEVVAPMLEACLRHDV